MTTQMLMNDLGVLMFIMAPNPYVAAMKIAYVDEVAREVRRESGQGIFGLCGGDLELRNIRFYALAVLRPGGGVDFVAGMYVEEKENAVHLKGLLVDKRFRGCGMAGKLIRAVHGMECAHGQRKRLVAHVRMFPCGKLVLGSLRAFESSNFRVKHAGTHTLRHDDADRHLSASQEKDGSVRYLALECVQAAAPCA